MGCTYSSVVLGSAVCFPSLHYSPASSPKSSSGTFAADIGGPSVAPHAKVIPPLLSKLPWELPHRCNLLSQVNGALFLSIRAQAGGLGPERERLLALGLPEPQVVTIQHARAPSTRAAYSHKWQVFTTWCVSHQLDP